MSTPKSPDSTRRTILLGMAGSVAAGGMVTLNQGRDATPDDSAKSPFSPKKAPLTHASLDQWRSEIGTIFLVGTEAGGVGLKLVSVTALPTVGKRPKSLRRQPFEARFEPDRGGTPAGDRLYPVRHADYGNFHLFFSPAGNALKALFN